MPVVTSGATTVGAVQISGLAPAATPIESWPNAMLTGKGYAYQSQGAAVAAQYGYAELRNPIGSNRNLWVYVASGSTSAAASIYYSLTGPPFGTATNHGVNLSTAALNSQALITFGNAASVGGFTFGVYPSGPTFLSGQPYPWVMVIQQNFGLVLWSSIVNVGVNINFAWAEI